MKNFKTTLVLALATLGGLSAAQWNGFHGGMQRTGYTSAIVPATLTKKWAFTAGGPVVTSPVIGKDGTIYLGPVLQDDLLFPTYDIIAINPEGTQKWRYKTPFQDNDRPTVSTPAIDEAGNLYVGTACGRFISLSSSGTLRWQKSFGDPIIQNPVIGANGTIYCGIGGKLHAFNSAGDILWRQNLGMSLPGGPSVAPDGTVYAVKATSMDESTYLMAFTAEGAFKWEQFGDWYYFPLHTPTVGPDGTVFMAGQRIHAYNPDGTEKWSCEPTYGINNYAAIAVDPQGNLYYSSYVYAWKINPQGAVVWTKTLTPDGSRLGSTYSSIVVDGAGKIFLPLGDGKRDAIDYEKQMLVLSNDGTQLGSTAFPEIPSGSPAIAPNGTIYVGSLDGKLYAFGG